MPSLLKRLPTEDLPIAVDHFSGDAEAQHDFARDLAQSCDDDYEDEGYFYQSMPQFYSLGRPQGF